MTTYLEEVQKEDLLTLYAMAQRSFRHFLPFVKVPVSGVGMVTIEMWPYVEEVVTDLENDRLMAHPPSLTGHTRRTNCADHTFNIRAIPERLARN